VGVTITFHYSDTLQEVEEVPEVFSEYFVSLFDCDAEILKMWELWPSFIQEYREHTGPTLLEAAKEATNEDIAELLNWEPDPNTMFDDLETEWHSSSAFAPQEIANWAQRWIYFIDEWNPEEFPQLFPYEMNLETKKSSFNKKYAIEALECLVEQAKYAKQHDMQLSVEVCWG